MFLCIDSTIIFFSPNCIYDYYLLIKDIERNGPLKLQHIVDTMITNKRFPHPRKGREESAYYIYSIAVGRQSCDDYVIDRFLLVFPTGFQSSVPQQEDCKYSQKAAEKDKVPSAGTAGVRKGSAGIITDLQTCRIIIVLLK